jgi:threonyl-tRNA synthetase
MKIAVLKERQAHERRVSATPETVKKFTAAGFRIKTDTRSEKIGHKIRDAQLDLIPYMLIVGEKEVENNTVALRCRIDGDLGSMTTDEATARLGEEVAERRIRQVAESTFDAFDGEDEASNEY